MTALTLGPGTYTFKADYANHSTSGHSASTVTFTGSTLDVQVFQPAAVSRFGKGGPARGLPFRFAAKCRRDGIRAATIPRLGARPQTACFDGDYPWDARGDW